MRQMRYFMRWMRQMRFCMWRMWQNIDSRIFLVFYHMRIAFVCDGCSKCNFAWYACDNDNAISHVVLHRVTIERHRTSTGNPTVTQQLLCCWRRQQWRRKCEATGMITLPVPQGWWRSNDDATKLAFHWMRG
jgi:hypothetical protein